MMYKCVCVCSVLLHSTVHVPSFVNLMHSRIVLLIAKVSVKF